MKLSLTILSLSLIFSTFAIADSGITCVDLMEDDSAPGFVVGQMLTRMRVAKLGHRHRKETQSPVSIQLDSPATPELSVRGTRQTFNQFLESFRLRSEYAPLVFAHRQVDIKPVIDMLLPIFPEVADSNGLQQRELANGRKQYWFRTKGGTHIEIAPLTFEYMSEVRDRINRRTDTYPMKTEDIQAWFIAAVYKAVILAGHKENMKQVFGISSVNLRETLTRELNHYLLPRSRLQALQNSQPHSKYKDSAWQKEIDNVTFEFLLPEIQMRLDYALVGPKRLKQAYFEVAEQYLALAKDPTATIYRSQRDDLQKPIQLSRLKMIEAASQIRAARKFATDPNFIQHAEDWIYGRTNVVDTDFAHRIATSDLYGGLSLERYYKFQEARQSKDYSLTPQIIEDIKLTGYNSDSFLVDYTFWMRMVY